MVEVAVGRLEGGSVFEAVVDARDLEVDWQVKGHLKALAQACGDAGLEAEQRDLLVVVVVWDVLRGAADRGDCRAARGVAYLGAQAGDEQVQPEFTEVEEGIGLRCSNLELRIASSRSLGYCRRRQRHGQHERAQP